MTSLYEITDNVRELMNLDLDEESLADTLESLHGEFDSKADSICHVIRNLDSHCEEIDNEIKRLNARKTTFNNRTVSLKSYLKSNMQMSDRTKIETPKFSMTLVKGRDVLDITSEASLARKWWKKKTTESIDKVGLLNHLKDGNKAAGASIKKSDPSLRIS